MFVQWFGIILWGIHRLLIDNNLMKSKKKAWAPRYFLTVENKVIFDVFILT